MLPRMFGMGGSEIIVILIVALLFLGPDKLPQAAKTISKGIRDIKKQSRALQQQIESDEHIGGAIRDLKSALRGEDLPIRPKPVTPRVQPQLAEASAAAAVAAATIGGGDGAGTPAADASTGAADASTPAADASTGGTAAAEAGASALAPAAVIPGNGAAPPLTLPPTAGEPDLIDGPASGDADLASLIKPAPGTVAKGS
jgi:sec-independent protein translocase protein TatB